MVTNHCLHISYSSFGIEYFKLNWCRKLIKILCAIFSFVTEFQFRIINLNRFHRTSKRSVDLYITINTQMKNFTQLIKCFFLYLLLIFTPLVPYFTVSTETILKLTSIETHSNKTPSFTLLIFIKRWIFFSFLFIERLFSNKKSFRHKNLFDFFLHTW